MFITPYVIIFHLFFKVQDILKFISSITHTDSMIGDVCVFSTLNI
ncbi:MAG: hypothetical protein IPK55_12775 [Streptococcus sp.]|nr:hypothetical protein [Streptococcus sp.]